MSVGRLKALIGTPLLLVALSVPLALAATRDARAVDVTYCSQNVAQGAECPVPPSGPRHTYLDGRTSYGSPPPVVGCPGVVYTTSYIAFTSSNGSQKYVGWACNYVNHSHPANTQLLRQYALYTSSGSPSYFLVGRGAF